MSDYGIKTYADLAETCGGMVLANEMALPPHGTGKRQVGALGGNLPVVHRARCELPHESHRRASIL